MPKIIEIGLLLLKLW